MSSFGIICEEPAKICEFCSVIAETRPYGPNNEQICFDCGMKNKEMTEKKFASHVLGEF
jgi:hypothetical protein